MRLRTRFRARDYSGQISNWLRGVADWSNEWELIAQRWAARHLQAHA